MDTFKVKTFLDTQKFNRQAKVGDILPRFFYYFGDELPKAFLECQTRENDEERQKYILLNVKSGREIFIDRHFEIEEVAFNKFGDRKNIDKGYLMVDPFLGEVTT